MMYSLYMADIVFFKKIMNYYFSMRSAEDNTKMENYIKLNSSFLTVSIVLTLLASSVGSRYGDP